MWLKNTDGKKDAVLTMATLGFAVVLIKVLLGGSHFHIGNQEVVIGVIDGSVIGALLTPTLGAYVARRYTDKKLPPPVEQK